VGGRSRPGEASGPRRFLFVCVSGGDWRGTALRGLTGCAHQICVAWAAKWEGGTDRLRPLVWLLVKLDLARGKALARLASGSSLLSIVVGLE
jgi:hypothetical protein